MDMRQFDPADREGCLAVFDSLTPDLIDIDSRADFEAWLGEGDPCFVMEHEGSIAGCGGFSVSDDRTAATLQWGMVRRDVQRQGLGRFLLMYRIREIGMAGNVGLVKVQAPHPSAAFFVKQGFRLSQTRSDRVELIKKLTVCA
jgi:N-acetylglutamate synthase-like GNAT family acetyltransferase